MKASLFLACSALGLALATPTQDAPETVNNPLGIVYQAKLPETSRTGIRGTINATAHSSGRGVVFNLDLWGFDNTEGPFPYHIHVDPVPTDGSCGPTKDHLDPFGRGQTPPCDDSLPQTCEPGDLSGKFGRLTTSSMEEHFNQTFHDLYTSTRPGLGTFFGNRSIVIHHRNSTRLTCANFTLVEQPGTSTTYVPRPTGTGIISSIFPTGTGAISTSGHAPTISATYTPTPTPSPPAQNNGAGRLVGFSLGAIMAALVPLAL
ncbi:TPA_exp: Cell surface Cu-only superoxide dismutase [Trichophyton benhamiae CBS 112371]|nr:TPA_exp: Cell surface Cu-only superoxide dismutase [Trichophyton benhamiae CBS 112371]